MSISKFEVSPILTEKASCTLLNLDGTCMMFDCGWDETFSEDIAAVYENKITSKVDYIFLSSNNMNNIGALPLLMNNEHCKSAKIYATTPIAKLGLNILLDCYIAKIEQTENFVKISDTEISSAFLNINEIKFKENIKFTINDWEIIISPLPSGESLGSSLWKIQYKLQTLVYAPQFSIKSKFICDPFAYESLKNVNIFITDTKVSPKISLMQNVVENEFKKNLLEEVSKGRNIFIPSDTANFNLEILIRLEKILDEYYTSHPNENKYRVLVCGYTSHEVVESIKSLIEYFGTSISQQFYSYNENPFNLHYIHCVKDLKEFYEAKKSHNVIVLSSSQSLDSGLSYKLLPEILSDPNFKVFLTSKGHKSSLLRKILKKVKDGIKILDYEEVRRIPEKPKKEDTNQVKESQVNPQLNESVALNVVSKTDLSFKKKLFAKSPFPMFAYHQKKRLNEYGVELNEKEIKIMKSVSEEKAEVFESSFKTFLYANNKNSELENKEIRLRVKRGDLFGKAHYEIKKKNLSIQAKFQMYDLFDSSGIDSISKETIIKEINPKDCTFFLGDSPQPEFLKLVDKLQTKFNINCKIVTTDSSESIVRKDTLLKIKYDSTILNSLPSFFVQDYGYVYNMKNAFLKIKTKRNEIQEINIAERNEVNSDKNILSLKRNQEFLDCFYTKADLRLMNLKREIAKVLNEELFIRDHYITNSRGEFKLSLEKSHLVLEGGLNPSYLKIRKCIYNNYINVDEI